MNPNFRFILLISIMILLPFAWLEPPAATTVDAGITDPQAIVNVAWLNDGQGNIWSRQATVIVNGLATYLPVVLK